MQSSKCKQLYKRFKNFYVTNNVPSVEEFRFACIDGQILGVIRFVKNKALTDRIFSHVITILDDQVCCVSGKFIPCNRKKYLQQKSWYMSDKKAFLNFYHERKQNLDLINPDRSFQGLSGSEDLGIINYEGLSEKSGTSMLKGSLLKKLKAAQ